jgi:hypothetical protein
MNSVQIAENLHHVVKLLHTQQLHLTEGKTVLSTVMPGKEMSEHERLLADFDSMGIMWNNVPVLDIISSIKNKYSHPSLQKFVHQWDTYYDLIWQANHKAITQSVDPDRFQEYIKRFRFEHLFSSDTKFNPYWKNVDRDNRNMTQFTLLTNDASAAGAVCSGDTARKKRKAEDVHEYTANKILSMDHSDVLGAIDQWLASLSTSVDLLAVEQTYNTYVSPALVSMSNIITSSRGDVIWPLQSTSASRLAYHTYLCDGIQPNDKGKVHASIVEWQASLLKLLQKIPADANKIKFIEALLDKEGNDVKDTIAKIRPTTDTGDPGGDRDVVSAGYGKYCQMAAVLDRTKAVQECASVLPVLTHDNRGTMKAFMISLSGMIKKIQAHYDDLKTIDATDSIFPSSEATHAKVAYRSIINAACRIDVVRARNIKIHLWRKEVEAIKTGSDSKRAIASTPSPGFIGGLVNAIIGTSPDKDELVYHRMIEILSKQVLTQEAKTDKLDMILDNTLPEDYSRPPLPYGIREQTLKPMSELEAVINSTIRDMNRIRESVLEAAASNQTDMTRMVESSGMLRWITSTLVYNQFSPCITAVPARLLVCKKHFPSLPLYESVASCVAVANAQEEHGQSRDIQFSHVLAMLNPIIQLCYLSERLNQR